jgi:hypothetical protein
LRESSRSWEWRKYGRWRRRRRNRGGSWRRRGRRNISGSWRRRRSGSRRRRSRSRRRRRRSRRRRRRSRSRRRRSRSRRRRSSRSRRRRSRSRSRRIWRNNTFAIHVARRSKPGSAAPTNTTRGVFRIKRTWDRINHNCIYTVDLPPGQSASR